ncbi:hypothetical protein [Acinetobacter baumannii]|uniref:hypothetical protein n=1 Tax=Acinetobacter baumannii TaxID=470 RepID=UPI0024DEF244|nr:hypothetical protein [Acinetobacter baumannii]MDK2143696.1 hypothetical protein [Acinetobacter baumannii]MDK2162243.1 hypothetical protein [Acinetobacter baumannii]MDK2173348.1 hypothetical protein [Acinetobacter baumannii]MDK2202280.1 hypothetical protein [Acinetobacter baumannii]MDK2209421.1 hypothetical protein [Acinetobacter baumannii]
MFDKNFKVKVSGNWCEYQPNKHIDLREIISFECWADQLGNPYRFHLKNGSHHYIERYEVGKQIENVLKEQQAKVEELEEEFSEDERFLKEQIKDKDLKISNLEYQQGMDKELIQSLQSRSEKLQKRVDAALKLISEKSGDIYLSECVILGRFGDAEQLEQALKGEG